MKPTIFLKRKTFIGLFLVFIAIGFSSMTTLKAYDPSGNWNYEIETGEETLTGLMTIKKVKNTYEVNIESDVYGNLSLESVAFKNKVLTASVDVQGVVTDFEMEFDNDKMSGAVYYDEMELSLSAKRE
ncbi:hypothetical protein [Polaribacter porphyrae]|uniref:Uncharacterized protein n=1 Tax=Polaribacter porphyrae TaxID=1137780 RepID=A0A2S7WML6_9FLAO|nr:hypothetical protein [Polaribacter porphyrae]PQJ78848.1 hypothetical protein BTO18_06465 [Polaribacter porphyrae]